MNHNGIPAIGEVLRITSRGSVGRRRRKVLAACQCYGDLSANAIAYRSASADRTYEPDRIVLRLSGMNSTSALFMSSTPSPYARLFDFPAFQGAVHE